MFSSGWWKRISVSLHKRKREKAYAFSLPVCRIPCDQDFSRAFFNATVHQES